MSMGIGGWAYLSSENESTVIYRYGSFSWNDPGHYNDDKICDGRITIHKDMFSAFPDSSQWIVKKVIEVVNCSNCLAKTSDELGIETIALSLIYKIMDDHEINNSFPEKISLCK